MIIPEIATNSFFEGHEVKKYARNKIIAYRNEIPRNGYLILSGTVKIYSVDTKGVERIVSFAGPGDLLPGAFILGYSKIVLYFYEAATDIECYEFSISSMRAELENNSNLALYLLHTFALGFYGSLVQIESLVQHRAQEKVLKLLRYLILRFGQEANDGWMTVSIRLTQNDIADMIGITRETVAIELGKLKAQGIIDYKSFTYRINTLALGDMVDASLWETYHEVKPV